jgi:hypothetical protein
MATESESCLWGKIGGNKWTGILSEQISNWKQNIEKRQD